MHASGIPVIGVVEEKGVQVLKLLGRGEHIEVDEFHPPTMKIGETVIVYCSVDEVKVDAEDGHIDRD